MNNLYQMIKHYFVREADSENDEYKPGLFGSIYSFFKKIFCGVFRSPKPNILTEKQKYEFEKGLGSLVDKFNRFYKPGEIILNEKKDLLSKLYSEN